MKKIVILGGGTAGTMMSAKLSRALEVDEWEITVVDQDNTHIYQPGLLFIPFGVYEPRDVKKPRGRFIPPGVKFVISEIDRVDPQGKTVHLSGGDVLSYDFLIIATGTRIVPTETEGLQGDGWQKNIFDFYTLEGATRLADHMRHFKGGRVVLNVVEMPIKCPVAPLEFLFLADWFFTEEGVRDKTEIVYATPLDGAFTKPKASALLGDMLEQRNIKVQPIWNTGEIHSERNVMATWDGDEMEYDLLVTVPYHQGSEVIARSELGDHADFVPTHPNTLQSQDWEDIFVIGDATNLNTSKAGSVAHFEGDILLENVLRAIQGRELWEGFDGHANCFIETGFNKAVLIDFNYDTEPLPGYYPLPGVGPFSLLGESEMNHWGKMGFRWVYWNLLLRGSELPGIEAQMSWAGKWGGS
ncbi:MAG: NAD(P)/FAD-dependent oxidoreductase [Gemmatimonadetes bacterium]|nr:NAD(P)/FAD-dependent oxidoreductase [Gemmatimonadota bacterium]NNM06125.1 NAD(P)/FAD-dependent oxidoreductase [Gemmatimonadota bacterium]